MSLKLVKCSNKWKWFGDHWLSSYGYQDKTCSSISLYNTSQNSKHTVRGSSELLCTLPVPCPHIPPAISWPWPWTTFQVHVLLASTELRSKKYEVNLTNHQLTKTGWWYGRDGHKVVNNGDTWTELILTCSSLAPWGDSPKMGDGIFREHLAWASAEWRPTPGCLDGGLLGTTPTVGVASSNSHSKKRVDETAWWKQDRREGKVILQGFWANSEPGLEFREMVTWPEMCILLHICQGAVHEIIVT